MREIDPADALRAFVARYPTAQAAAAALGITPSYLVDLRRGRRAFSARMLAALGLRSAAVAAPKRVAR